MARRVVEYRCLLISPGDVEQERQAVVEAIEGWNALVGAALDTRVHLVRWETHGVPDASAPPQEVLNRQIVDECDFGIAVFWTRIGTATATHPSGSIEEIDRLRERGARVMVYVSSAAIPHDRLKDDQFQRLSEFKERLQQEGSLGSYRDTADLRQQIPLHVTAVVAELLQKDRAQPSPAIAGPTSGVLTAPKPDVRVVVFPAETVPRTPGVTHLLGIRIQNHSPVMVYMSGISILLKSGRGLLLFRDVVTGREQSRIPLRPGESYMWSASGDALLKDVKIDDVIGVVAYDDIGREFREPEGTLRKILQDWSAKRKPASADEVNR